MTPFFDFPPNALAELARVDTARALAEDVGSGDLTAGLIDPTRLVQARVLAREAAVICGAPWAEAALQQLDPGVRVNWLVAEGQRCNPDQVVLELRGSARTLLTAERTVLNFLQLLSAVATKTADYVAAVQAVPGNRAQIVDTRKTLPGLRQAQKYAVRTGGGMNHRMGLFDAVMLKENHIHAEGSIAKAVAKARMAYPDIPVIVEVESLLELREALATDCSRILIDDFTDADMREAVKTAGGRKPLEVSGSVTLERLNAIAEAGVDFVSVGSITKNIRAIDFSMRLGSPPDE